MGYEDKVQSSIQVRVLPEGLNFGVVKLLDKGGNKKSIGNWRPISLLNVSYKIKASRMDEGNH